MPYRKPPPNAYIPPTSHSPHNHHAVRGTESAHPHHTEGGGLLHGIEHAAGSAVHAAGHAANKVVDWAYEFEPRKGPAYDKKPKKGKR